MQPLERLELVGDARRQGTNSDVADVSQQVLDSNLLCFLGLDDGRCVDKRSGSRRSILNRKHTVVSPYLVL